MSARHAGLQHTVLHQALRGYLDPPRLLATVNLLKRLSVHANPVTLPVFLSGPAEAKALADPRSTL